jgi:hypothetical protein
MILNWRAATCCPPLSRGLEMKTQTVRLVALGRGRQSYGTRVLTAGEEFEMPRAIADTLIRIGKAKLADREGPQPSPPRPSPPAPPVRDPEPDDDEEPDNGPDESTQSRGDDIGTLRARASALGIAVDRRWGLARLQYEIKQRQ